MDKISKLKSIFLEDEEVEDVTLEFLEDTIIYHLQDYLNNYYYYNSNNILNSYLDDKLYSISRKGSILDYVTNDSIIRYMERKDYVSYINLLNDIFTNILNSLDAIGYVDNIRVYDVIHGIDTHLLIYWYGWHTSQIDNEGSFTVGDLTFNINEVMRV